VRIRSGANLFFERGDGSGSCWNEGEAILVGKVVLRLRVDNTVSPAEIAVITPYAEQKTTIKGELMKLDSITFKSIKVDLPTASKAMNVGSLSFTRTER
jgi:AAA domain